MLQVDRAYDASAAGQWHGEKCLVAVLGQFMEELESRIHCGLFGDRYRLVMFRNPARDALSHAEFEAVDNIRMRVLRSAQYEMVTFENIDEAGITLHQRRGEFHHPVKHVMKATSRRQAATNFVE